jgi:hypothetical protein
VLAGTGTAGVYHAGVLRALHEAGVKIDVVAGRGVGVVGALFAAIDGAHRLWDQNGLWRAPIVRRLYPWQPALRVMARATAAAVAVAAVPLAAMAIGLIVFPIDFVLKMLGTSAAQGLTERYMDLIRIAFAPGGLPTWLPRLALLLLVFSGGAAFVASAASRPGRRGRGPYWWQLVDAPLSAEPAVEHCRNLLWELVRGAAALKQPAEADLARRYVDLLLENLGQPGFRELLFVTHDTDARRDLVFALVAESRRQDLLKQFPGGDPDGRRAEVLDLSGVARDHLMDAVAGALHIPLATGSHAIRFAPESYWRGETHRLCDRPAGLIRVLEELDNLGVEQVLLVLSSSEAARPHSLAARRLDGRGRLGEYLQSSEAAVMRDLLAIRSSQKRRLFVIRPVHNPIGPLDFSGGFDDRSDRPQGLQELMARGYEDAYLQFIEPVVAASGDQVARLKPQSSRLKS